MADEIQGIMADADVWRPGTFYSEGPTGPVQRDGYIQDGLGICVVGDWAPDRNQTRWMLVHLGSGAGVVALVGSVRTVMPVALEIARCIDWTLFDMPMGWQQTAPDLPDKIMAINAAHPGILILAGPDIPPATTEGARKVMAAREGQS